MISEPGLDAEAERKEPLIAGAEFTFWGGRDWSVLFAEGDWIGVGFDDLSGAEEV
ncbi:hypothetical protein GCM10020370_13450 [Paenibacillus hodogayensis]